MNWLRFLSVATGLLLLLRPAFGGHPAMAQSARPNIVIILADDFGVGDIQAHYPENRIATPYLDRLVQQGMSFTDAHSGSSVCTPTRYGLLTGRYAWRTRLQEWVIACYEPPLIDAGRLTLPAMLRENGYHTSCIGKWHLGWDWSGPQKPEFTEVPNGQKSLTWDFTQPIASGPIDRGFDDYFGVDLPNFPPFTFIEQDHVLVQPTDTYQFDPGQGHVMPQGFVGCPMAPGWQFDQILPELTRRAVAKIHEQAKNDKPFFLYFSMTSPHEPVVPSAAFRDKSGIAPVADFVMETDWSAGQVLQAIDDAGLGDNTLVIFTADNGHSHYTGWEKLVAAGHMPSGPYRGHKGDIWEGGHRVPLVARWPGKIAPGSRSDQMVCLVDLFATCADLLHAGLPATAAPDSFSFLSAATGEPGPANMRSTMINHSRDGEFAFRAGQQKLVLRNSDANLKNCRGKPRIAELYDLGMDCAETTDLAGQQPAAVNQLTGQLIQAIGGGATRPSATGQNDTGVDCQTTQSVRWGVPE